MNKINPNTLLLEGRSLASIAIDDLDKQVAQLKNNGIHPHMAVILVGHDRASEIYVSLKQKQAQAIGIDFSLYRFEQSDSEEDLLHAIDILNSDNEVHGIMVQLPLPEKFDREKVIEAISIDKDIDGLRGTKYPVPTVQAIWHLIEHYDLPTSNILIVGKGRVVGAPLAAFFQKKKISFSQWQSSDFDAKALKEFDLIISATGKAEIISKGNGLDHSSLIDASGKDLDFDALYGKVSAITPPVGGVGPLTISYLLSNCLEAARACL